MDERESLRRSYYEAGWYRRETFADVMKAGAARHPRAKMIYHSDTRPDASTLGAMHRRGVEITGALWAVGVRPGDVVAIQVPNWLEGALVFQAAMMLGVVILPIIHIYGPSEVEFILRQSGAKMFVCPDRWRHIDYLDRLAHLDRSALPSLERVLVIGDDTPEGAIGWRELVARGTSDFEAPAVSADDVCCLIYTSGTTADPKGVLHSHNTLLAEVRGSYWETEPVEQRVGLSVFPAGHVAGLLGLARVYTHGADSILMDVWNAEAGARLIDEHAVTNSAGTPFHLSGLLDAALAGGFDLSSLSGYMIGAANVPPSLVERADAAGVPTYRCYGSSEHPTLTSALTTDSLEKRAFTDGRPAPGNELRIVDDEGADVPTGTPGEIVSRGPELFLGYRDDALNDDAFLPGGWFRSGDIGVVDAEGYLAITDRKKDIIIRGGENIASKEVEDVLARHPAVGEAAVTAAPDPRYGERVCAFVILRDAAGLDLDAVRQHFEREGVARQKAPEQLELVDELPRTGSGKVKKFELRERLRRDAAGS